MKNLLFILPIIAVSFNLQAQQVDFVTDSNEQAVSLEDQLLDAVVAGDIESVIDFLDVDFMDGKGVDFTDELGEEALAIAMRNGDISMVRVLWERGAKLRDEDGNTISFVEVLVYTSHYRDFRESTSRFIWDIFGNITKKRSKAE